MGEATIYKKAKTFENIEVGDVIMLDVITGNVKRAVVLDPFNPEIDSRLVVGICTEANNTFPETLIIDGGTSDTWQEEQAGITRVTLWCGDSEVKPDYIEILGGDSNVNPRQYIKVAYTGQEWVNVASRLMLGDKLCISRYPGKAISKQFMHGDYIDIRSLGKALKLSEDGKQAYTLLDIE